MTLGASLAAHRLAYRRRPHSDHAEAAELYRGRLFDHLRRSGLGAFPLTGSTSPGAQRSLELFFICRGDQDSISTRP
jgi:hypothetical protein